MYRHCIYCSASLGANEAIEHFPVGRKVAFDAAKGRLWAICATCARWNLAPIEERWEAVEEAERRFVASRTRVHRENIGLARLADGTRLVRIGRALPREMAAWRYGEQLRQRRTRYLLWGLAGLALPGALLGLQVAGVIGFASLVMPGINYARDELAARRRVHRLPAGTATAYPVVLRRRHVERAGLREGPGGEMQIVLWEAPDHTPQSPLVVRGAEALRLLERVMVVVNRAGARAHHVDGAVDALSRAGTGEFLARAVRDGRSLRIGAASPSGLPYTALARVEALALEMALHEERERRALDGELTLLESAWRDAERIADIADRLALPSSPGG